MAPDSGIRLGRHRQRELFHHEVQGTRRPPTPPPPPRGIHPSASRVCLCFQLMDMSEKLWQVYNRLDPVSLDQVITEVCSASAVCSRMEA